ncbi:hypothetical protein P153DRAFT_429676 [Dothidotthia symphoricarpi CBS 119687]|uniref:Uncharacterized protein n=1 Tax=Dothidotthia symphoricarpi CBS 119687 TaxID=1392245 RepID=A0A6A6AIG6_9PLEO|nr:uncharacterized protein P153DRAFT_429676 [Dothidotthia symphoricarpi CBS 119687]KAF2131356.1 hypothetical protein P153DRAFT_429676 [Dothidotthia symphoricarpi CBS 119687]
MTSNSSTMISVIPSTTLSNSHPNFLSRLPPELRHIIYSFCNFPVSGHVWVDCLGHTHGCAYKSHIIFHEDAKWPMAFHALPGEFVVKRRIKQLISRPQDGIDGLFRGLSVQVGGEFAIRNELLHLLFDQMDVYFEYVLSNDPASQVSSSTLQSLIFTYLTSITLTPEPHQNIDGSCVALDTTSISFITAHCPNLHHLTYMVIVCEWLEKGPTDEGAMDFAQACHLLTVECKKLQGLHFEFSDRARQVSRGEPKLKRSLTAGNWGVVVIWVCDVLRQIVEEYGAQEE